MNNPPKTNTAPNEVTIYTDGAASPNPGQGGYGVILIGGGKRLELSGGFRKTTNNRMELFAVIRGLRALKKAAKKVTIYSDSTYVVDMLNGGHVEKWRQNGWRRSKGKRAVINPDLWDIILNLAAQYDVKFVWVRGHGSNPENTRCDELAVAARQKKDLPVDEGYENPVISDVPDDLPPSAVPKSMLNPCALQLQPASAGA
jgi:ribonuclease HI